MEDEQSAEIEVPNKNATVHCVQYLVSHHMKSRRPIKKDYLMKTVFKNHRVGKNYERIMEDVAQILLNVFGFSLCFITDDQKQFIIVNTISDLDISGITYGSSDTHLSKYFILLKPILSILVMHCLPISEGQMWNIMETFADKFNLDFDIIKTVFNEYFIKDQYLQFKGTDEATIKFDPEKTTNWFSLGPRALLECNQIIVLDRVSKLYNVPTRSFKRVYSVVYGNE